MTKSSPLLILGGSGAAGSYLAQLLCEAKAEAVFVTRRPLDTKPPLCNIIVDFLENNDWQAPTNSLIISLLPLWELSPLLPRLAKAKAIIATSSTSLLSKALSDDALERAISDRLSQAEQALQYWAAAQGITWTLLRPTLIYDGRTDKNLTRMAAFIRRWGFLPLAYPSNGLRQPIHTEDVAKAVLNAVDNPKAANRIFNISGGEILSYRQMVERIFAALKIKPRLFFLPVPVLKMAFGLLRKLCLVRETSFGASLFQRMNEDLVFETQSGIEALNYAPRDFQPTFADKK